MRQVKRSAFGIETFAIVLHTLRLKQLKPHAHTHTNRHEGIVCLLLSHDNQVALGLELVSFPSRLSPSPLLSSLFPLSSLCLSPPLSLCHCSLGNCASPPLTSHSTKCANHLLLFSLQMLCRSRSQLRCRHHHRHRRRRSNRHRAL